jgi:hypothetical protein
MSSQMSASARPVSRHEKRVFECDGCEERRDPAQVQRGERTGVSSRLTKTDVSTNSSGIYTTNQRLFMGLMRAYGLCGSTAWA